MEILALFNFFPKTLDFLTHWILLVFCLAFIKEIEIFLPSEHYPQAECNSSQFRKKRGM